MVNETREEILRVVGASGCSRNLLKGRIVAMPSSVASFSVTYNSCRVPSFIPRSGEDEIIIKKRVTAREAGFSISGGAAMLDVLACPPTRLCHRVGHH